jgi:hypothetical protein
MISLPLLLVTSQRLRQQEIDNLKTKIKQQLEIADIPHRSVIARAAVPLLDHRSGHHTSA